MPSRSLDPDTRLSVKLGAICTRNKWNPDHAATITELRKTAGDRTDLLEREVGTFIGYYEDALYVRPFSDALRGMTDLDLAPWIELGRKRRHQDMHGTSGFGEPHTRPQT